MRCIFIVFSILLPVLVASANESKVLSLGDALEEALDNNLDLAISRMNPANAQDEIEVAESRFGWDLFSTVSMDERQAAASSSSLDSASVPESESRRLRVGGERRLSTGARVTLDTSINRSSSNNNAARNPDYGSDIGVSFRQSLLRGRGNTINLASVARAKIAHDRSLFSLKGDVLDVLADTELAYLELVHARAARELTLSSIELAESLLAENLERERLGVAIPLDVLQAETVLSERREDLVEADRRIADAQDRLSYLIGRELQWAHVSNLVVSPLPAGLPPLEKMSVVIDVALENDTAASLQERVVEIEKIDRLLADNELRPELDLTGGLRYTGRDSDGADSFRGAYRGDGYNWNAGLEFRVPWGARQAKARLRQADRAVEEAEITLVKLKRDKVLAVRNTWRAVEAGQAQILIAEKTLELNELTFEQERARYQSGAVSYRRVLEAQRELDAARIRELRVRVDTLRSYVTLSRIDGSLLERHGFTWEVLDRSSVGIEAEAGTSISDS